MMLNISKGLERAKDALEDAKIMFREERFWVCVSRSYYAIFYCMQTLLFAKGLFTKTHKGVLNLFNLHYVKTGIIEKRYSEMARDAFADRQKADYDFDTDFTANEVAEVIQHAEEFLKFTKAHLTSQNLI